ISIFSVYVALILIFVIPTVVYLDETIIFLNRYDYEVTSDNSYTKLQRLNTDRLSNIILPSKSTLNLESTTMDDNYMFDSRLPVALWLNQLKYHLIENNGILDPNFSIPFSWNDWIDLNSKLQFDHTYFNKWVESHNEFKNLDVTKMNCKDFMNVFNTNEDRILRVCKDLSKDEKLKYPNYPYNFKFIYKMEIDIEEPGRKLFGASYLYTSAPSPTRLHFVGAGMNDSSVIIMTDPTTNDKNDKNQQKINYGWGNLIPMFNEMLYNESKLKKTSISNIYKKGFRISNIVDELNELYNQNISIQNILYENELLFDQSYLMALDPNVEIMKKFELNENDFIWNHEDRMNSMQKQVKLIEDNYPNKSILNSMDYQLLKQIEYELDVYQNNNNKHPKYLIEANCKNTRLGNHFDWRFFNGIERPENFKKAIIHRIGRAWLRFCYQSGLRTFVAYGSMLGWVRNGLTLSWDEDIDVVVTMDSLFRLARNHNQSLIIDVSSEDKYAAGVGSYFLDIGPSFYTRVRGGGANAIDGRLIDTKSGVYVDITAVAYTENYFQEHNIDDVILRIIDKDYFKNRDSVSNREEYENELKSKAQKLQDDKQLYHCRNDNVFSLKELSPMVPTMFEGVRAFMPHDFDKLLRRKYPGALDRNTEPGHTYKKYLRLWVKDSDCPGNDRDGEFCQDEEVVDEYYHTKEYTLKHNHLMKTIDNNELHISEETIPMRYDEFIIDYANLLNAKLELRILENDKSLNLTDFFNAFEETLSSIDDGYKSKYYDKLGPSISKLMNKLPTLNENNSVPLSILQKRMIDIMVKNQFLTSLPFNRVCFQIMKESLQKKNDFDNAIKFWVEYSEYFKNSNSNSNSNENEIKMPKFDGNVSKHGMFAKDQYQFTGLIAYFLSVVNNKKDDKFNKELIDLILDGCKHSEGKMTELLKMHKVDLKSSYLIINKYINYLDEQLDINDLVTWSPPLKAAQDRRSEKVNSYVEKYLNRAKLENIELSQDVYNRLILIFNTDKQFNKSLKYFEELIQVKGIDKINVESWNSFLNTHVLINTPNKEQRIKSVWKLMKDNNVELNSESSMIYINGLLKCGLLSEALGVISDLKKRSNGVENLITSEVKESILSGLLENKHYDQANKLYDSYLKDENFKPTIRFYNKYMNHLLDSNRTDRVEKIFQQLIKSGLQPDVATYTLLMDRLLKRAKGNEETIVNELNDIFTTMKKNNVLPSEKTLTSIIHNFITNPRTSSVARFLFDYMKTNKMRMSSTLYTAMISGECINKNMQRALELFQEGLNHQIKLTPSYYNSIFKGFINTGDKESILKFYELVKKLINDRKTSPDDISLNPNFFTFYFILKSALEIEDKEFISWTLNEIKNTNLITLGQELPYLIEEAEKLNSYKLKIYSLGSDSKIPIGSLTYNQEATRWTIIPTIEQQDQNLKDGKYCVSLFDDAEINELISCFNFKELVFPLTDTLVIETFTPNQATLELDSISLRNTPHAEGGTCLYIANNKTNFPFDCEGPDLAYKCRLTMTNGFKYLLDVCEHQALIKYEFGDLVTINKNASSHAIDFHKIENLTTIYHPVNVTDTLYESTYEARFYEFFQMTHKVLLVFFTIGIWYHCFTLGWIEYIAISFSIWATEYILRIAKIIISGGVMKAKCSLMYETVLINDTADNPIYKDIPHTIRVEVNHSGWWRPFPGAFCWIYFLSEDFFWQSHPFTVVSPTVQQNPNQLVFIIRVENGLTKKMAQYISSKPEAQCHIPMLVEGPYGSSIPFKPYDNFVFVAGGVGMTIVYTIAMDLARTYKAQAASNSDPFKKKNKKLLSIVWMVPSFESLFSFRKEIDLIEEFDGLVELQIFITRRIVSPTLARIYHDSQNTILESKHNAKNIKNTTHKEELKQKCKDLKQKIIDVEGENEVTSIAVSRAKQAIKRLRFEYALLLESLEKKAADLSIPNIDKLTAEDIDAADIESIQLSDITHLLTKTPLSIAKVSMPVSTTAGPATTKRKRGGNANSLKKQRMKDPDIPKRPTNAYLIFCEHEKNKVRKQIEEKDPDVPTDLSKAMTEAWKKLDDVARKPYYELYEQDRLRYQTEIKAYNLK
ncbi:hypothetical protein CANARDRAFT_180910, partial [[Candida] arabinofermentans NRRL YB-2248]